MCSKREKKQEFGHKKSQHVPEKGEEAGVRSQEEPTCARKGRGSRISVTRRANMCPKRERKQDFGHKKSQHVPEKGEEAGVRSQEEPTCARKGRGSRSSVTSKAHQSEKQREPQKYGHKSRPDSCRFQIVVQAK